MELSRPLGLVFRRPATRLSSRGGVAARVIASTHRPELIVFSLRETTP